jgi:hypothetical protein
MIFGKGMSGLVRLTDSLKWGLDDCARIAGELIHLHKSFSKEIDEVRLRAANALKAGGDLKDFEEVQQLVISKIPEEVARRGVFAQIELHNKSLTAVLTSCFCLESYINSLCHFLFIDSDSLNLKANGCAALADTLLETFENMTIREKWWLLGRLRSATGFNKGASPYQDFNILFRFRDDIVHDKVRDFSKPDQKKYKDRFPDPTTGFLTLSHALYAAKTYWAMVKEVHKRKGTRPKIRRPFQLC